MPEDEADLAYFLKALPADIPVIVVGLGSNLIVRDGGIPGVVVRLGRGFNDVKVDGLRIIAGPGGARREGRRARRRRPASAGFRSCAAFRAAVGGALRMNGGAYGGETKDVLVAARAVDRAGQHPRAQQRRHALHLPALRRAGGFHLHRGDLRGPGRRSRGHRRRNGQDHRVARGDAADQEPHRRLDLQEPARPQGLAIDRRRPAAAG